MKSSSRLSATDRMEELIMRLMPTCLPLQLQELVVTNEEVALMLVSCQSAACCPLCTESSTRVHSHYRRTLQDLPWGPLRVQLHLQMRRFFCQNPACPRKIFTEPLTGLTERSSRRTRRLREALLVIGWALGGQAGARQCAAHAMPISRTTLLSLFRHWGSEARPTPRVLGVDDWTFQARSAGTLLVDLERHQPVEVLLGSDEQVLADWLLTHPGVEVIVRDRGASYLKGARHRSTPGQTGLGSLAWTQKSGRSDPETVSPAGRCAPSGRRASETEHPAGDLSSPCLRSA